MRDTKAVPVVGLTAVVAAGLVLGASGDLVAQANGEHGDTLTLVARESGCSQGKSLCFEVTEGTITAIQPGANVTVTLKNPAENDVTHNVHVARLGDANESHEDTAKAAAFANTTTLRPGEEETITFTVPEDAEGTYLWCDVTGHERAGMWWEVPEKKTTGDTGQDGNQTPFPLVGGLVAVAAAAYGFRCRREGR